MEWSERNIAQIHRMQVSARNRLEAFGIPPDPVIRAASGVHSLNNMTIINPFSQACHHQTIDPVIGNIRDIHVEEGRGRQISGSHLLDDIEHRSYGVIEKEGAPTLREAAMETHPEKAPSLAAATVPE